MLYVHQYNNDFQLYVHQYNNDFQNLESVKTKESFIMPIILEQRKELQTTYWISVSRWSWHRSSDYSYRYRKTGSGHFHLMQFRLCNSTLVASIIKLHSSTRIFTSMYPTSIKEAIQYVKRLNGENNSARDINYTTLWYISRQKKRTISSNSSDVFRKIAKIK